MHSVWYFNWTLINSKFEYVMTNNDVPATKCALMYHNYNNYWQVFTIITYHDNHETVQQSDLIIYNHN